MGHSKAGGDGPFPCSQPGGVSAGSLVERSGPYGRLRLSFLFQAETWGEGHSGDRVTWWSLEVTHCNPSWLPGGLQKHGCSTGEHANEDNWCSPGTAASGLDSARGQLTARYSGCFTWPQHEHRCSWQGLHYGIFLLSFEGQDKC